MTIMEAFTFHFSRKRVDGLLATMMDFRRGRSQLTAQQTSQSRSPFLLFMLDAAIQRVRPP